MTNSQPLAADRPDDLAIDISLHHKYLCFHNFKSPQPIHDNIQAVVDKVEQQTISIEALERFGFYAAARRAYALARTSDTGPYSCLLSQKGVI